MPYQHTTQARKFESLFNIPLTIFEKLVKKNYGLECVPADISLPNFFDFFSIENTEFPLIRLGQGDGSYLIPDDMKGISHCISPGFGGLMTFENELYAKYGIPSVIVDREVIYESVPGITFIANYVDMFSNRKDLNISLANVVSGLGNVTGDLMLQMDIESSEWLVLRSLSPRDLDQFRIMVIEFHSLHNIRNRFFYEQIALPTLRKILNIFAVVHVNVNESSGFWTINGDDFFPDTIEVTFHHKRRTEFIDST